STLPLLSLATLLHQSTSKLITVVLIVIRRSYCSNDYDLLNPPAELEKRKHKLKRLVQSPNSFFMDVKCQGCFNITTVFSHSQTVVVCGNCQTVLCQPTGGRARLTEGCSFRRKGD
ncbi:PREDICTED: 40S ribosomal protein S27-2-like, partial [Erythranthe guttata]